MRSARKAEHTASPAYSWPKLLRRPQALHPRRFVRSRILDVQESTPAVRSVTNRHGYSTWKRLATFGPRISRAGYVSIFRRTEAQPGTKGDASVKLIESEAVPGCAAVVVCDRANRRRTCSTLRIRDRAKRRRCAARGRRSLNKGVCGS